MIIPFESSHAYELLENSNNESLRPNIEVSQFVEDMVVPDMSFTCVTENRDLIAAGGIYLIWEGVGEAWFLGSNNLLSSPIEAVKSVKRYLNSIMKDFNLHRVQAMTLESENDLKRWMKFLNMKEEGIMNKYCRDGRNFIRWAKVI